MEPTFTISWTDNWAEFSSEEKTVYENYEKRDGFSINGYTVKGITSSSCGSIKATKCLLKNVSGRDGVTLLDCSAEDVSSTSGKVTIINGKASKISGRDGVYFDQAEVNIASTSTGKLFGKNCTVTSIAARDGIELIESKVEIAQTSQGVLKAEKCTINDVEARDGVTIKNCVGKSIQSSCGKIVAFSDSSDSKTFDSLDARDGIELTRVSSKKVLSTRGPVNCLDGDFDFVQAARSSSLKKSKIKQLEISVAEDEELTINLKDSEVGSVAIKVKKALSKDVFGILSHGSKTSVEGFNYAFGGSCSSKCVVGNKIDWYFNGSKLIADPKTFKVEGKLLKEFDLDIRSRCKVGTKGSVNGMPATVTSKGIEIEETKEISKEIETKTKITFIGGSILGNIVYDDSVKIDVSKTTFSGKMVSE